MSISNHLFHRFRAVCRPTHLPARTQPPPYMSRIKKSGDRGGCGPGAGKFPRGIQGVRTRSFPLQTSSKLRKMKDGNFSSLRVRVEVTCRRKPKKVKYTRLLIIHLVVWMILWVLWKPVNYPVENRWFAGWDVCFKKFVLAVALPVARILVLGGEFINRNFKIVLDIFVLSLGLQI